MNTFLRLMRSFISNLRFRIYFLPAFFIIASCVEMTKSLPVEDPTELVLLASYQLQINDPSGLTIDASGNFLWTVSDDPGQHVYAISFTGEILNVLTHYAGDDLEGITMNPNDGTLWVAEERLRQIVQLTTEGIELQRIDVPVQSNNPNDGLEGIAWNPLNNHVYVLNEKNPRMFIELNTEFNVVRSVEVNLDAPFFMEDLAGLFFVHQTGELWFVSDDSKKIVVTDLNINPIRTYPLPLDKFEGIAVDIEKERIYLVNDRLNRLYVYELPAN